MRNDKPFALLSATALACSLAMIAVQSASAAPPATISYNATVTAINGTGNANTGWSAFNDNQYHFGLDFMAQYNYPGYPGSPAQPPNPSDGAGTYLFPTGLNPNSASKSKWNFWFSIDTDLDGSGTTLAASPYDYYIGYEAPAANSFSWINLKSYADNSYGTDSTPNGGGTVGTFAAQSGSSYIMQNSENIAFAPISATVAQINANGTWRFALEAVNLGDQPTATPVDIFNLAVQVGPVPEPGTLALTGLGGIMFLGWVNCFRRRA